MADSEMEVAATADPDAVMLGTEGDGPDAENGAMAVSTDAAEVKETSPQTVFLDYLKSPIIELMVGSGDDATLLTAHRALLTQSPFFSEKLASVSREKPRLDLASESLDAVGCFLQYQYTGEYFPRRDSNQSDTLENDPSVPELDDTGSQLLRHARVYTLAGKFGAPKLKRLAHSKIHLINSTAVGEIAYARYVYGNTPTDDNTIRKPVAAFWATRSHVLRHEAEDEFRKMCLEYPQFGFDVLNLVLDQREKRTAARGDDETPMKGSTRKRMRSSVQS